MNVIVQADHIIPEEMAKIQNQVESRTVKTEMITNETTYSITSKISTTQMLSTTGNRERAGTSEKIQPQINAKADANRSGTVDKDESISTHLR